MTKPVGARSPDLQVDGEVSLLALAGVLIRWRRLIAALGLLGGVIGLVLGQTAPQLWTATAVFIPQGSEGGSNSGGLAIAASQFGINTTGSGSSWGPPMYVELLRSRALLEPLGLDTVTVVEERDRKVRIIDLLGIDAPTVRRQTEIAAGSIGGMVKANEEKKLGAVRLSTTTQWPSVSLQLTQRLLERVNEFNIEMRKSRAAVERTFVEAQSERAIAALRDAEDRLLIFLQRNRFISGSSELGFEHDRLKREVTLRQELYTSWLKSREEARIREVRNTPVITVLEDPRLPYIPESRKTKQKIVVGVIIGMLIAVVMAFLVQGIDGLRRSPGDDAQNFLSLIEEATPRFLRR